MEMIGANAPLGKKVKPIGIMSRGLFKIPYLEVLLGAHVVNCHLGIFWEPIAAVAGWGYKKTAQRARLYAKRFGLDYLAIEDGFIRSVGLGKTHAPLSLIVDQKGIYYNASQVSDLEILAQRSLSENEFKRSQNLMHLWRKHRISKYNHLREYEKELPVRYVLVIDQTLDDASVTLGQADASSFTHMLESALSRHPSSMVLIKTHPEVRAGYKKGYFDSLAIKDHPRIEIITDDAHPTRLLEFADAVYTVTSQLGFEALLWGRLVYTFGMPFYAGWGLTIDCLAPPSRRGSITLEQLTYAALIDYPKYLHPETHQLTEVEKVIEWIALQRKFRGKFARTIYALGFSFNKRQSVRNFLDGSEIIFTRDANAVPANGMVALWGSQTIARSDLQIIRLEDGFIRSVGLGADLIKPISWVGDTSGIYYDASKPSDLETMLLSYQPDYVTLERARQLRRRIVEAGLSKYNLPGVLWRRPPHTRKVILVPGQVESDASIAYGTLEIKRNIDLLKAVRAANPRAYILYKPHPDVVAKLRRKGASEDRVGAYCNEIILHASIHHLIGAVDEVHVMTSLTGFEALLRNRKVVTYGLPFYAGWGLTVDIHPHPRRNRRLSLDELVGAVLIEYPTYRLPDIMGFATPEAALTSIIESQKIRIPFKNIKQTIRRFVALHTSTRK